MSEHDERMALRRRGGTTRDELGREPGVPGRTTLVEQARTGAPGRPGVPGKSSLVPQWDVREADTEGLSTEFFAALAQRQSRAEEGNGDGTSASGARDSQPVHRREGAGDGRGLGRAQGRMEQGFGADLSAVRVHEGDHVSTLGALAYTQGTEIHFAPGKFDPDSPEGLQLIGHEVAHVMQQAQGRVAATAQAKGLAINDDRGLEREADELGLRVSRGERVASGWSTPSSAGPAQAKAAPIQMAAPGEIEHIGNSCYAASILTLLAMVARYRTAFDPQANPRDDRARELQECVHPLLVKVRQSQRVTAPEMDHLVRTLHEHGITMGEQAEQQDAAQVMMGMLARVITPGNRGALTAHSLEDRAYDAGEPRREHEDQNVIQVGALGCDTLEDALRMQFPTQRRVDTANEGVTINDPHALTRKLTRLPDVLTISVTHANDRDTLDMPQQFTVPAEVVHGIDPPPRYRLRGFIMRNHSGSGGGHYVSYVSDGQDWYHSNDMGGGPRSPETLREEAEDLERSGGMKRDTPEPSSSKRSAKPPQATVEPRVDRVQDMGSARYGSLPAQAFALGHVYTYERIEDEHDMEPRDRVGFGPVNLDPLPELPRYQPTRGTPRTKRSLAERSSPWVRTIDGKPVDLEGLSVPALVALLDDGKLFPPAPKGEALESKAEDSDVRLIAYLTSRARNFFYESINHVPGFDPSKGTDRRAANQGPLPTEAHDELALYQRAKEAARTGSVPANAYLRVMTYRFTRGLAPSELRNDEAREKSTEKQLGSQVNEQLASEYTAWMRDRGEQVTPQGLHDAGTAITKLVIAKASPKAIVDEIIRQCPELCEKYRVECASQGMRFYEHAQMVMGQYLRYFRDARHPLVSLDAMVKMILFHDLDKKLARELGKAKPKSKSRSSEEPSTEDPVASANPIDREVRGKGFSGLPTEALGQRLKGGGKSSEHGLTRVMMQKYAGLWPTVEEALLVTEMVDGDPIGHMLSAVGRREDASKAVGEAYTELLDMAQRAGIARTDGDGIRDFYHHVKMFYQADSSSYSGDSEYAPWEQRTSEAPAHAHGNEHSQLAGLYEHAPSEHFQKDEQGYLRMNDEAQRNALAALEDRLAKLPKSEHGTARDSTKERQSWDSLPQYHWSDLQILGECGNGSTKPLHVRDHRDGDKEKFLKLGMTRDPIHVMTEMLTNSLYDEVGAPVPDFELIMIEGQPAMISTWNPKHEVPKSQSQLQQTDDFLTWVSADFLFANYDLFKLENWSLQGPRMVRADNGGALDYRAQGNARKPENEWEGGAVEDQLSMRTVSHGTKPDPYKGLSDRRVAYSILRVCDFLDAKAIDRALSTAHCPAHRRAYLRGTLLHRLGLLRAWASEHIQISEVSVQPPDEPEASIFDCFFHGVSSMLQGLGYGKAPETHTTDQAPKIEHQSSQFLDAIRPMKLDKAFFDDLRRMRHGVLIRRLAIHEADGFSRAAKGGTTDQRHQSVFGKQGDPWKRGEVVFSVNRAYEFKREEDQEKASKDPAHKTGGATGTTAANDNVASQDVVIDMPHDANPRRDEDSTEHPETEPLLPTTTAPPKQDAPPNETGWTFDIGGALEWMSSKMPWSKAGLPSLQNPNYDYVLEIPITDEALEFLEHHSLVQGPKWPEGHKANPNLKYERVKQGELPNVIVRGHGFEKIWECFDKIRIYQPGEHVSFEPIPGSDEAARERLALLELERKRLIEEAAAKKKQKESEPPDDDIPFDDLFRTDAENANDPTDSTKSTDQDPSKL